MVSKEGKENDCLEECVQRRGTFAMGLWPEVQAWAQRGHAVAFRLLVRPKEVSVPNSHFKDPGFPVGEKCIFGSLMISLVADLQILSSAEEL